MKNPILIASLCTLAILPWTSSQAADTKLKQAKIIIEHNATDNDTGFQISLDADGWQKLELRGPAGPVAEFRPMEAMSKLGFTELFLETVEPENAKVSLAETLAKMPEGEYRFLADASELGGVTGQMTGTATLSHKIPQGVTLLSPKEDAAIAVADTKVAWSGNGLNLDGSKADIIAYQLIIEKDEEPHPRMVGKRGLSMILPATVQDITIAAAFFEPATPYKWEVLAIADNGNQTLQSGAFKTR